MEAVGKGVRKISLQTVYVADRSAVKLLRPKPCFAKSLNANNFSEIANRLYGARYSWRGAAASVAAALRDNEDLGLFCSKLVAHCYSDAGVEIFNGLRPEEVTPATIESCSSLYDVTPILLKPYDPKLVLPKEHIDCGLGDNLARDYQRALSTVHRKVISSPLGFDIDRLEPETGVKPNTLKGLVVGLAIRRIQASSNAKSQLPDNIAAVDLKIANLIRRENLLGKVKSMVQMEIKDNLHVSTGIKKSPLEWVSRLTEIRSQLTVSEELQARHAHAISSWRAYESAHLSSIRLFYEMDKLVLQAYRNRVDFIRESECMLSLINV